MSTNIQAFAELTSDIQTAIDTKAQEAGVSRQDLEVYKKLQWAHMVRLIAILQDNPSDSVVKVLGRY